MNFTLHKHIGGCWSIEKPGGVLDRLAWDEMLGEVAMILMAGRPHRFSASPRPHTVVFGAIYSLRVLHVEDEWYSIRRGNRFIDRLACNEALGFIAAYTLTDGEKQLYHGLQTYEQWLNGCRWNRDRQREIAGLITYQPELVA